MPDVSTNPEVPGGTQASWKLALLAARSGIGLGFLTLAAAALTGNWTLAAMGVLFLVLNGFLFTFLTVQLSRIPAGTGSNGSK